MQKNGGKILVIKHGALGDIVQGFDGFESLRAGHPDAHLAVLTTPAFAGFMAMMPFFDEVLIDRRASPFNLIEAWRMRQLLRRGWQRVYDFQSSKRSRRYLDHLVPEGVEIVGYAARASHPLPTMTGLNNRDRMLLTAEIGGCPRVVAETGWLASEAASAGPGRRAVLVPGSSPTKPEKRWPEEHYAALAHRLADAGYHVTLVGTAVDRAVADAILAGFPDADDRVGQTSLAELAALLAGSALVVGNDTGPVFLAATLGAPTLMLMSGHTDPAMSAPTGPCTHWLRQPAVASISPDEAAEAALALAGNG